MSNINVTDHALVRWLERVGGIDMDYFRDHIRSLVKEAYDAGFVTITIDDFTYVLDKKTESLIRVLEPRQRVKKCKNKLPRNDRYSYQDDIELFYTEGAE